MASLLYILKGFLIGIIASIPIGPILILTVQKSVNDGRKAGFSSGLGATVVDTTCALISALAVSHIGNFIDRHQSLIALLGGFFIICVGVSMILSKIDRERKRKLTYSPRTFVKSMTMGFLNPAALGVMLALFAFFKMTFSGLPVIIPILSVVAVAMGSMTYWYCLSRIVAHYGEKFNFRILLIINRIAGVAITVFGIILVGKGLL